MDTETGRIYPNRDAALKAGVPPDRAVEISGACLDAWRHYAAGQTDFAGTRIPGGVRRAFLAGWNAANG